MVNTALVAGHTERDNLLLSFSAMVPSHTHTHTLGLYAGLGMEVRLVLISGQDQSWGIRESKGKVFGRQGAGEQWGHWGITFTGCWQGKQRRCDPHKI